MSPRVLPFAWLLHHLPIEESLARPVSRWGRWSIVFVWGALGAKTDALVGTILGAPGLPLDPPRGAHIVGGPDAAPMRAAIRYVQSVVPPNARIFVGNARHDSLVLNEVMVYFLPAAGAGRDITTGARALPPPWRVRPPRAGPGAPPGAYSCYGRTPAPCPASRAGTPAGASGD